MLIYRLFLFFVLCFSLVLCGQAEAKSEDPTNTTITQVQKNKNPEQISATSQEIRIDLWKRKLFLYENGEVVYKFNIAPGKEESPTPVGHFNVISKRKNWGSGFGTRWLGLDVPWGTYGIHGTNKPWLIGQNVSGGCIRMRNQDVEKLFNKVKVGTKVIIDGPIMGAAHLTYRVLVNGSTGPLVQLVQNRLRAAGFYKGVCHGKFDRYTEISVLAFQKKYGLTLTGQIGYDELVLLGIIE